MKTTTTFPRLAAFFLGFALWAGTPSETEAQDCDGAICNYMGMFDEHYFDSSTCSSGGGCRDCESAPSGHIGCHATYKPGECSTHTGCGESFLDQEAILAALVKGSGEELALVVAASDGRIELNETRTALQIRNCKGALSAHIPLSVTIFEGLRAELVTLLESRGGVSEVQYNGPTQVVNRASRGTRSNADPVGTHRIAED